ncbi:MAG: DUF262 domain-containing protein [archaeon]|nr:DUF262 domain-containing protein [archaeon]
MSDLYLVSFFQSNRIIIPLYQRNYDWKKQNCRQLLEDIRRIMGDGTENKRHFIGAIIYTNEKLDRVVIDGQQRITTVQLLLLALRDAIKEGKLSMKDEDTVPFIKNYLGKKESVLVPCGKDNDAFQALYEQKSNDDWSRKEYGSTHIWSNYDYLKDELIKMNDGEDFADRVLEALENLWVVPIELKESDDPQAVFESINTTGLKLGDSDRIRNFIMMNHPQSEQQTIYNQYWTKIEEYTGNEIETFFYDFLKSVRFNKVTMSDNGIYQAFKETFPLAKTTREEKWNILNRIRDHARIYRDLLDGNISGYSSEEASRALRYITYLDQKIAYSFILNLLSAQTSGELSREEVSDCILYTETYLERRMVTKEPPNALNGLFPSLFKTVKNLPGSAPFSDKYAYLLRSKEGNLTFPDDDKVATVLIERDIYRHASLCNVVLAVANYVNRDSPDILPMVNKEGGFTLDHIMPRNPNNDWYVNNPALDETLDRYLNTIGNLTLTSYNSNFGNRSFDYRLNTEGIGYKYSSLYVNEYLKQQTEWKEEQIVERAHRITKNFLNNRRLPDCHRYSPSEDDVLEISLSEDVRMLTNTLVLGYSYKNGTTVSVKNAVEAYKGILKELYEENPDKFTEWTHDDAPIGFTSMFHPSQTKDEDYYKLATDVYVWASMSNHDKFSTIQKILDALEIDANSVVVKYKIKNNSSKND